MERSLGDFSPASQWQNLLGFCDKINFLKACGSGDPQFSSHSEHLYFFHSCLGNLRSRTLGLLFLEDQNLKIDHNREHKILWFNGLMKICHSGEKKKSYKERSLCHAALQERLTAMEREALGSCHKEILELHELEWVVG